jgi:chemotaxis family two-component system sensor histidine kinase/response regulator PixL
MANLEIRDRNYQFFIEEAPELLQIIEMGLLTIKQERTPANIHEIMRAAHSLKGSAASVGLEAVKILAHYFEDIFKAFYSETVEIDAQLETWLLEAFDRLKDPLTEEIATGECDWETALSNAIPILTKIEERLGDAIALGDSFIPSSTDLGVDMVASIFEIDVAEGLKRLDLVLANPQDYEVAGELRAQSEVFAGFAEMFNLSGFCAIANTTITALNAHRDRVLEIMQLALADFRSGRDDILQGDRQYGGSPSIALQSLAEGNNKLELQQKRSPLTHGLHWGEETSLPSPPLKKGGIMEEVISLEELFDSPQSNPEIETVARIPDPETFAIDPTLLSQTTSASEPLSPSTSSLSVKVDLNRLERMNNFVGESIVNSNSLSLQNEHLSKINRELLNRAKQFQDKIRKIQNLSDRFLLQGLLEEIIQLKEKVEDATLISRQSDRAIERQRQTINSLKDELMWARMLPIGEIFNRFPRTLRDLCLKYNKSVNLKIVGAEVLVDRGILEKLHDPLLHLLRNAFDHGIESTENRQQQGKPAQGQIEMRAYHQGNQTIIEISDDGAGINLEKIAEKAIVNGTITPQELATLPSDRLVDFIFEPSFSTANSVSELSGRGIGLDVVRSQLQAIKGNVSVTFIPGRGTTFSLRLPLTLTIAKLLICSVGSNTLAFPLDTIEEIVIPQDDRISNSDTQRCLQWRDRSVQIYRLTELLNYNYSLPETSTDKSLFSGSSSENLASPLLVIRRREQFIALEIDRLEAEKELVIKPFSNAIAPPSYTYGCTIWGDGSLFPVIDGAALVEYVENQKSIATAIELNLASHKTNKTTLLPTILIIDDSIAMRQMLARTLEKADYRVIQAKDGWDAIEKLRSTFQVNLIISDIDMPKMNGFEFLSHRRQHPNLTGIPVAMLTSRNNPKHRQLAMHLGAYAYWTKPFSEPEILNAVGKIISQSQSTPTFIKRKAASNLPFFQKIRDKYSNFKRS